MTSSGIDDVVLGRDEMRMQHFHNHWEALLARVDGVAPFVASPEGVYSQIGRRTIEYSRLQELMDSIRFWKVALTT